MNPYQLDPTLSQGTQFLANLGTFWSKVFTGRDTLVAHHTNALAALAQDYITLLESVACLSRFKVPVYHRENWQYLTVLQSQLNSAATAPLLYGTSGVTYGDNYQYGQAATTSRYRLPLPVDVIHVAQVLNRPVVPSVILSEGVDFRIDTAGQYVEFVVNPFINSNFVTRSIINDAGVADVELELWLSGVSFDWHYIHDFFGYSLGLYLNRSSSSYRDLVNALWNALQLGPTALNLRQAMAAACRLPLVIESTETVEAILYNPLRVQIITDQHVYDVPAASNPIVIVGQTLSQGDLLTDAIKITERITTTDPVVQSLPAISIGDDWISLPLQGSLTFLNTTVAITWSNEGPFGYQPNYLSVVTFAGVDGYNNDLALFWKTAHDRSLLNSSHSVANSLRRISGVANPRADELYPTVNPMLWVLQQTFGHNAILAVVNTQLLGVGASPSDLQWLRQVLPAHIALIVVTQTTTDTLNYTVTGTDTFTADWYSASENDLTMSYTKSSDYTIPNVVGNLLEI